MRGHGDDVTQRVESSILPGNNRQGAFSEKVQKLIYRRGQASFLSLSHSCLFCGGEAKPVNSHGSDFSKLELVIHLFSFATEVRGEDLQRSAEGEIRGFRKWSVASGGVGEPLWVRDSEADLKHSCESVLIIVLPLYALLCSSLGPTGCEMVSTQNKSSAYPEKCILWIQSAD